MLRRRLVSSFQGIVRKRLLRASSLSEESRRWYSSQDTRWPLVDSKRLPSDTVQGMRKDEAIQELHISGEDFNHLQNNLTDDLIEEDNDDEYEYEEFEDDDDDDETDMESKAGKRLAKAIAESRYCSRRQAEVLIEAGVVSVNGNSANVSVSTRVQEGDKILVKGKPLPTADAKKFSDSVFLCYKLRNELITYFDPEGRRTLFQRLEIMGLPRNLIPVGRLDYESEGLIILTTDGEYARMLELPENGFVRKYLARVRKGEFTDRAVKRLAKGISVKEGNVAKYRPILVRNMFEETRSLQTVLRRRATDDKDSYKNKGDKKDKRRNSLAMKRLKKLAAKNENHVVAKRWLEVAVTEGKNREVRKALRAVGLYIDRLIRTDYGPYSLGKIPSGSVLRVKRRAVLTKTDKGQKEPV